MQPIYPAKLKKGSHLRIIAPARSLRLISQETQDIANKRLEEMGLKLSFGEHVNEADESMSSSVESRVADLHQAFSDPDVDGILAVIGGYNSNQLLDHIDWELIRKNPKVFCGFSDITVLNNSIFAKTSLVNFSGPHYSSFGQKLHFEYTQEYFEKMLMEGAESSEDGTATNPTEIAVKPSTHWSDDLWFIDQNARDLLENPGFEVLNEGEAEGRVIGGNMGSLRLLQGTKYMPDLKDSILFLEDCVDAKGSPFVAEFDRNLQSLIHSPGFEGVRGIVFGRSQKNSEMTTALLKKIVDSKKELRNLPMISGVDFGHTDPKITLPIGGEARVVANGQVAKLILVTKN
jgi:muramoyltetrapeptide carboxypeptidase